jgi:hypothetical protein
MKKITLWLFALFTCWQINAQVLTESFDGATFPPTGWTNTQDSGTGLWNQSTTGTNPTCTPHSGAAMARFNSYTFTNGTTAALSSAVIDLSSGDSYRATFWMYRDSGYATNEDKVEVFMNTSQNLTGATSLGVINRSSSLAPVVTSDGWYQYSFAIPSTFNTATNYVVFKATSDFGNRIFLDDVVVELIPQAAPGCVTITSPANNAVNVSNPTFIWNANVDATGYYINVGTTLGGTDVANGDDMGTATSFTVPEAEPGTTYYATVSPYNANGTATGCIESNFTTCNAFTVPFTEGFNSTSATEGCWSIINANSDGVAWNMGYATTPIEGDQSAMIYTDFNGGANNDYLVSPKIVLTGNQRLVFKYKVQSATEPNNFAVLLSTTGNAPADFTTTLDPLTSYSNISPETKVIALTGISGQVHIAWHLPAGGLDGWRLYIDEVVVEDIPAGAPNCVAITSPINGAINVSNPTFTWATSVDATGYYINVGTFAGGTDVANGDDMGTATSFTVPEAEAGTTYYATVLPYNASGTATGCTESSFTTCNSSTDFVQDFEATTGAIFPDCWSKVGTTGAAYTQASAGITGARNLYMYSSSSTSRPVVAIQTVSNASAGTHRMRMKVRGNFSAGETIELGYLTNPADATTFTAINSIVTNTTVAANAQDFVTVPTGMPTGDVVFALRTGPALLSVLIDNVAWEPIPAVAPSCVSITSPVNAAVNVMNSRVTWASDINATGYKLSVGTASAATDILNMQDVGNVLSYAFTSDPGTTYHVTVYPYNPTGQATGCTEISFTTCDGLTPDVLETFDTFLPSCWQEADGGDITTGPVTFGSGAWTGDDFANSGTTETGAIKVNIDYLGDNGWVISPIVEIPATGYELKFDAASTDWGQTTLTDAWGADDKIEVLVSTTGLTNWTVLYTYDTTNQPGATAVTNVIDLDAYAGQNVRFAYRGVEGATDDPADIDFFIDNFNVRLTPSTAPSCAIVTSTPDPNCGNFSNTLSWAAASGANGYRINVGSTPGGTQIANNVDLGNVLSYSFTGTMATTYYFTVLPYNGVGPATGCAEQSFTTNTNGCYCTSAPTSVDVSGITNIQVVTTNFPNTVTTAPVYNNHTATIVDMARGVNNNVQITFDVTSFGTTFDYNTVIWVDFNDDYVLSNSEIVYNGVSPTTTPTLLNASFVMPSTAPLGNHRMRIVATDDQQIPVNPCYSGIYGETADFTINVVAPSCTPPAATSSVVFDCTASQFSVAVNVSALGNGSPSISNGTTTWPVTATGVVTAGPFNFGTPVTLTLLHGTSTTCDIPLGTFNYAGCPPVNDDCANASVLTPGGVFATNSLVGTNQFASASVGAPAPGCASYSGGDVWYSAVVPASGNLTFEVNTNTGGITDGAGAVYSGTCGSMALLACNDSASTDPNDQPLITVTGRTPGEVLYFRVWEYGNNAFGTFKVSAYDASLSNEEFDGSNFIAYPNPVKDVLNLSYTSEITAVRVLNLLGQEVISQEVNTTSTQIDMSHLSTGTYIVNVTVGDSIKVIKVVKQ